MFKNLIFACAVLVAASACQSESSAPAKDGSAVQEGNINDDNWSDADVDSENLTDEAESILAIDTLDETLGKLTEALKLKPSNARADVWASFIKLELETKGILARVRPFIESMPNGDYEYQKMIDSQASGDQGLLRRFYLDGPNDIHTADEFQEWVDRVDMRLSEFRETLSRHKGKEVRLLVPKNAFGNINRAGVRTSDNCIGKQWGPIKYQPSDCSQTSTEFLLNRTDMEAVGSLISSYQAGIAIMNAYRISQAMINKIQSRDYYEDGTAFGILIRNGAKLRTQQNIKVVGDNMRDFALAARYILDHQKEACPKGRETVTNRKGYLFGYGICVNTVLGAGNPLERTTALINQVLNRQPLSFNNVAGKRSVDIDVNAFIAHPIEDLHAFDPMTKTQCGTFEPNFTPLKAYVVKGDLEDILRREGQICGEDYMKARYGWRN